MKMLPLYENVAALYNETYKNIQQLQEDYLLTVWPGKLHSDCSLLLLFVLILNLPAVVITSYCVRSSTLL
jgi:hypothetical protein